MGRDLRPSPGADLGVGSQGPVPTARHRRRAGRSLPTYRRVPRPEPGDACPREGGAQPRGRAANHDARGRDQSRAGPCHRPRGNFVRAWWLEARDAPHRRRRQRGWHLRPRDRPDGRSPRPSSGHGPPVRHHQAHRAADRHADPARPVAPRVLPRRERRPRRRWLRAQSGALRNVGHRGRLQQQAPRRGLGALRPAVRERHAAGPGAGGGSDREARERAGGVHTRRGVHSRPVGGGGLVRGGRLLPRTA